MYTTKRHVLELVALLKVHGIKKIVLCPGSRNIPIIETISNIPDFSIYQITDERSAAFFALGLALHGGTPAAVCCTSGSALVNMHPAVAEAFYQKVPLLVISADRPKSWINQMDGQTMPQANIFGSIVKKSVDIPEINTKEDLWYVNRLINEAILALDHHSKGPSHINIQISEPFFDFSEKILPDVRVIDRYHGLNLYERDYQSLIDKLNMLPRRMAIAGQMNLIYLFDKKYTKGLYKHFVWIAENLANQTVPGNPISNIDMILYSLNDSQKESMRPDILITYGGHIISKRLKDYLRTYKPKEHWHISEDGEIVDLFGSLTIVIEMNPFEFWEKITTFIDTPANDYSRTWENISRNLHNSPIKYSQMLAIGMLIENMPQNTVIHLSNSSSVRYAQLFNIDKSIEVLSNRGMNGIEGSLSTALGYSVISKKINFIVIGDLSFFYDMNALWNTNYGSNIRILLLNNSSGEIFKALPRLKMSEKGCKYITASHKTSAKAWAEDRGFKYMSAIDEASLKEGILFITSSQITTKPLILEVFTDSDMDVMLLKDYFKSINTK